MRIKAGLTDAVQQKMLYLPLYYAGGAVAALAGEDARVISVSISRG